MDFKTFVGIDISKLTLDIAILDSKKQSIRHRQVTNDEDGHKTILELLNDNFDDALFCMEHTGVYGVPITNFLAENGCNYSLQSPLHIKQSMGVRRGKNDKADAKMLAQYAYLHKHEIKLSGIPSKIILKLQNLLTYRERLIRSKVSLETASGELAAFTEKDLHMEILRDSTQFADRFKQSIERVESEIMQAIKSAPEIKRIYDLITSIPGVGLLIAAYLIVYTRCFSTFSDWRKMACYCGIAPFEHTSGSSIRGKTRVSHIGNKKLKTILGMGALAAIGHDKELQAYYNRKIEQGKAKSSVINAVKNKMLSRIFATVKRGTPYVKIKQIGLSNGLT